MRYALVILMLAGCLSRQTEEPGGSVSGIPGWADLFVAFAPGEGGDAEERGNDALGPTDSKGVRLGGSGVLTVGISSAVINEMGNDFEVTLLPGGAGEIQVYVSDSDDDRSFIYTGTVTPEVTGVDLDTSTRSTALYVRLVSLSDSLAVDAIRVLHRAAM